MGFYPWRRCFGLGWKWAREYPWTWVVLGLVGAHQGWWLERQEGIEWVWPGDFSPVFASELVGSAAVAAGDSVAAALGWPCEGEPLSVILALAMFFNVGDIGLALRRGCRTAFVRGSGWFFALLILSAVMNVGWVAVEIGGWWPLHGWEMKLLHGGGLLWTGATVAFALGWLVRLAETYVHAPEEVLQIAWTSSAAGRIPRLWPVVLAVVVLHVLKLLALPPAWLHGLRWSLALCGATLPLVLVHWRGDWGWGNALREAAQRWRSCAGRLAGWLVLAVTHCFLFHLAHRGIASGLPVGSGVRLGWDFLMALLHGGLVVWLLGAWVAHQPKFAHEMKG